MTNAARFRLKHKELCAEPYHYKMCGLDDIYLLNGFKKHETKYGSGVSIENSDVLHKAIGLYLIKNRKVLSQKDIKFLRKNMGFTQEEVAECLGVTSQTVARYEKGASEIPTPVDKLLRFCYVLHLLPQEKRLSLIEEIDARHREKSGIDETSDEPVYFGSTPDGWNETRLTQPHELPNGHV